MNAPLFTLEGEPSGDAETASSHDVVSEERTPLPELGRCPCGALVIVSDSPTRCPLAAQE